ncbi:MAG: hypothetical protein M3R00_05725 [Pseudomonadota bacterium]|nr:hypothetical protein [Pseudomonadota bacterium]
MVKGKEQNMIEQLEALADQPEKKGQFDTLVGKMQQGPITQFFIAYNNYFMTLNDYYQGDTQNEQRKSDTLKKANEYVKAAQDQVDTMLKANSTDIAAQYLNALIGVGFSFDEQHKPVIAGSSGKWLHQAATQCKKLAETGFGPAVNKYITTAVVDEPETTRLLVKGRDNGSVLCKAQLAQRYFSYLIGNVNTAAPNQFTFPSGMTEAQLIKDFKEAIRQGDYTSMGYLQNLIDNSSNILMSFAEVNHQGSRNVSPVQIQKLQQLAQVIKQLSNPTIASKLDQLIGKANQIADKFKYMRTEIGVYPKATTAVAAMSEKSTDERKKIHEKHMAQLWKIKGEALKQTELSKLTKNADIMGVNVLLRNRFLYAHDDKAILASFKSHPKLQKSIPAAFRSIQNLRSRPEKQLTKKTIAGLLSEQEIDAHLREQTSKEVSEAVESVARATVQVMLEKEALPLTEGEVVKTTAQSLNDRIDKLTDDNCKPEMAELKKLKAELVMYVKNQFATEISKTLATPRTAIRIGEKHEAPKPITPLAEKIVALLAKQDLHNETETFYNRFHSKVELCGGIDKILAEVNRITSPSGAAPTNLADFAAAYRQISQEQKPLPTWTKDEQPIGDVPSQKSPLRK